MCFVISGLNDAFHWYDHCVILSKSSLRFDDDIAGLMIVEKREVPSANNFALQRNPCGKSLMKIRKSSRPKIEPCGTPASTRDHFDD